MLCTNITKLFFQIISIALLVEFSFSDLNTGNDIKTKKTEISGSNDDYFYDSSLTKEDIKKIQDEKSKLEEQRELENEVKQPAEKEPDWFARSNNTDDPMAKFMEEAIKDYMKRMQKEYMEKMKGKKKSDINHQFWSVITLAVFFGTGISIGLAIVVIRGNSFNKGSKLNGVPNSKKKKTNCQESINRSSYASIPQKEQITI